METTTAARDVASITNPSAAQPAKARYLKLGPISHPNQVPNH